MIKALIKAMRLKQWTKNGLILAALVFDRQLPSVRILFREGRLTNIEPTLITLAGVLIFCFVSSAVYLINDIADVDVDRKHPTKRNRPIASGKLPIPVAAAAAGITLVLMLMLAFLLSKGFFLIILAYILINLAYSKWLKHIPLVDVLTLSSGFVLRVAAGVSLIQVQRFSPWLYVVTTLLSLYLGFSKRRAELTLLAGTSEGRRKVLDGYSLPFLDQLTTIVSATTIISYSLYTFSAPNVPANHSMMLTIPFVLYGIFRYLYLVQVKQEIRPPDELLLVDHPLQAAVALWGLSVLVVFYLF